MKGAKRMDDIIEKEVAEKAGVGRRFVSCLIDGIIMGVIGGILAGVSIVIGSDVGAVIMTIVGIIISIAYYTYLFGRGQTLGMMAMKIKLIRTDGTYPIGYLRGFLRCLGMLLSGWVIYIGYLWIVIDKDKQGWHDKIADTYVVPA